MPPSKLLDSEAEDAVSRSAGKAKGTLVIGVVKSLRWLKEKGRAATPPHLRHYLDTRSLPSSWYAEEDYLGLLSALVSLAEPPEGVDAWDYAGRLQEVGDAYRNLIRRGDPQWTLSNFPLLWKLRHDTGTVVVLPEAGRGPTRVEISDFSIVSGDYCKAIGGTIWAILHHSGARGIRVSKESCRATGGPVCAWDVSWESTG